MIDAFAELKDKDATRDEDKEGMCYICSITRSDVIYFQYLDVKKWGNFQQTYQKTFPMVLYLLYLLFGSQRPNRLHRNRIFD